MDRFGHSNYSWLTWLTRDSSAYRRQQHTRNTINYCSLQVKISAVQFRTQLTLNNFYLMDPLCINHKLFVYSHYFYVLLAINLIKTSIMPVVRYILWSLNDCVLFVYRLIGHKTAPFMRICCWAITWHWNNSPEASIGSIFWAVFAV